MAPVGFRPLSWTDIPDLVALEGQLFGHEAWAETSWWAELAARPRREYTVVTDEVGGIVGYAGLDHGGEVSDVMTIATAPSLQGNGVGRLLLGWLVDRAAAEGAEALLLEVRADNDRALDLYSRNGFHKISVRRGYYQPGGIDAVIMRRHLRGNETHD